MKPLSRFLVFVYLAEAGVLLVLAPWTRFWERNYFVEPGAWMSPLWLNHAVRGAISGIGLVCLAAAVIEIAALAGPLWTRRTRSHAPRG